MTPSRVLTVCAALFAFPAFAVEQPASFKWSGAGTNPSGNYVAASGTAPANWAGNTTPTDGSTLSFGASEGLDLWGWVTVSLPSNFSVHGLEFTSPRPVYELTSADSGSLTIGAGGITLSGASESYVKISSDSLALSANQTWDVGATALWIYSPISESSGSRSITKAGSGTLYLQNSASTFSGGFVLQAGTLSLGGSSTLDGSTIEEGPVGTGTLTLGGGTTLSTHAYETDVTLHNAISLGTNVTLGNWSDENRLILAGAITPQQTGTTIYIGAEDAVFLSGPIGNATAGATELTFAGSGSGPGNYYNSRAVAVLTGANTYSGGTVVDDAGLIFYTSQSLPTTGSISGTDGAYISTGYSGGMEAILAKITNKAAFDGALGFDTDPDLTSTPTTFTDTINLSSFTPDAEDSTQFWGLGTLSSAVLTGTITPPTGGNYVFGGGEGTLYVASNLTASTGVRVRSLYSSTPLSVWLQGNNTFTGKLLSDHSVVVLDSATALPAVSEGNPDTGRFQMDTGAYVGYTENTGWTPAQFIARYNPTSNYGDSILGFDSAAPAGRTIADAVNLSAFTDIFIGSTTHVHLAGAITPPSSGQLSLVGVKGGWLTIDSALLAGNITSLNVGNSSYGSDSTGYVELTGANTYTGGTNLINGYLLVSASSTLSNGSIVSGPLGTGTLSFTSYNYDNPATVVATQPGVTLHNDFSIASGVNRFGVPLSNDEDDSEFALRAYSTNGLTLAGNLSGHSESLHFVGDATFTLTGDNQSLSTYGIFVGTGDSHVNTRLMAGHNRALGSTSNSLYLGEGADLVFNTTAPEVGSLSGGGYSDGISSYVTLTAGSTLTINQNVNASLTAHIGGAPADYSTSAGPTSVAAALIKTGEGNLTLNGTSALTGGVTITSGTLTFGTQASTNVGSITLNGGRLGLGDDVSLSTALNFGTSGGTLTGNGTFGSLITVGTGVALAPGNSPGTLTFTNGLTLAGGGSLVIEIADLYGTAGSDYDTIAITGGALSLTADAGNPFVISVNSLTATSGYVGLLGNSSDTAASLTILSSPTTLSLADLSRFALNTTNFTSTTAGTFSLALGGVGNTALMLNFTPVPEPSTYALMALGLGFVVWQVRRRRTAD